MIKRIIFTFVFLLTAIFPPLSYAIEEKTNNETSFATSYDVTYDVGEDGITTVTEKITLKNLTSQLYANKFSLTIGATDIFDAKASEDGGVMQTTVEKKDISTIISVDFNQQIAGINKTLPWALQFKSKDFAQNLGKVWEVRAPKISSSFKLENYNLTISVPLSFGEPTLISPSPKTQTVTSGKLFLTFDKDQLQNSGVSANFGTTQVFDFDLNYHLEGRNIFPVLTNIALPPDTTYQDIMFQRITPQPINVSVDADGNYLAWYRLKRGEKLNIKVLGSAKLYANSKVKNPTLSKDLRKKYISGQKYWEKDNPAIISKLQEIFGEHTPSENSQKVKLIYQYVVNSLKYNSSRLNQDVERFGAVTALNNPDRAVCMEFTDLFIALVRAVGIPAMELDGYAYTSNTSLRPLSLNRDTLHAWPEYWDEKRGWIMVDPTWENTSGGVDYFNKLDLNHLVFVNRGSSSTQPVPVGSYKLKESPRDVKVTFSGNDFLGKSQLDVQIDTQEPIISGLPAKIKVKASNSGNFLFQSSSLLVTSSKLNILDGAISTGPIPSFGNASFEFNARTKSLFESFDDQVIVSLGGQKISKNLSVKPLIFFRRVPFIIGGVIFSVVIIYLAVLATLLYRKKVHKINTE